MIIKIEHGIPIPGRDPKGISGAVRKLQVGDSIVIPKTSRSTVVTVASRSKIRIATRRLNGNKLRVWRIK